MIKKDADMIWNSIPVDLRNKIKNDYKVISKGTGIYDMAQATLMREYFGEHNLKSVFNVGDQVTIEDQIVPRKIVGITKDGYYVLMGKGSAYPANILKFY